MDYQEAIEYMRKELHKQCVNSEGQDAYIIAISAMKEIQAIHNNGISLERLKDIDFRKQVVEHINYDAYMRLMDELEECKQIGTLEDLIKLKERELSGVELAKIACNLNLLEKYKQLGTMEEVRDAVEKQKKKRPTYDGDGYAPDGTFVWDEWICPNCGAIYEVDYDDYDNCPNCGQRIDWSDED